MFAPSDAETLSITASLVNRALGFSAAAEDGWEVEYTALPPSIEERDAKRREALELLAAGLLTQAEARAAILGGSIEDAEVALARSADRSSLALDALDEGDLDGARSILVGGE